MKCKFFFISAVLLLTACSLTPKGPAVILPSGKQIQLELAVTEQEKEQGLMDRISLAKDSGMLFVLGAPQKVSFWMKNTLIPLDILYLDEKGTVLDILTMSPCPKEEGRCPTYPSSSPASYGLEINAGEAKELGLKTGDHLQLVLHPNAKP